MSQNLSQGYPGYVPAAKPWIAKQDASGYYVKPLAPVFAKAATEIWTGWSQTPWDVFGLWASNVTPNLVAGSTRFVPAAGNGVGDLELRTIDGFQVVTKA